MVQTRYIILTFLIIFLSFLYFVIPSPLSQYEFDETIDKLSFTSQKYYAHVLTIGKIIVKGSEQEIRAAILYPFYWTVINFSGKIYVLLKGNLVSSTKIYDSCPEGLNTFFKLTNLNQPNAKLKCLGISVEDILRKIQSEEHGRKVETLKFDFFKKDDRTPFASIFDFANYLLLKGLFKIKQQ